MLFPFCNFLFFKIDAPSCSPNQPRVYGVAKQEQAQIRCSVDANPADVEFKWTFNNSAESIDVASNHVTRSGKIIQIYLQLFFVFIHLFDSSVLYVLKKETKWVCNNKIQTIIEFQLLVLFKIICKLAFERRWKQNKREKTGKREGERKCCREFVYIV